MPESTNNLIHELLDPKFIVSLLAIGIFIWAYGENVSDQTMIGAIIGGFNLALGFHLGAISERSRQPIKVTTDPDKPLPVKETTEDVN